MSRLDIKPTEEQAFLTPFLSPQLSLEFADRYIVRSSILESIKQIIPRLNGILVDLGCGEKPYQSILNSASGKVQQYIGIDLPNPGYHARTLPELYWNGQKIPFKNEAVDCVVATEVFEHIPDLDPILKESCRILKPGGILFFTVPFLWPLHDAPHDEYRYTPFSLERLLTGAGFVRIELKALGGWDAALAQMIGLWMRRRPMTDETRTLFSEQLFPLYQFLLENDELPHVFTSGTMFTGLSGVAMKPELL
jgi:SAM-dependent methyltransferase